MLLTPVMSSMRTSFRNSKAPLLLLACLLPVSLEAGALGVANAYNVFVFNNLSITGADTGGRIAVGGTASFPNYYSIGQHIIDTFSAPNNDNLVVDASIASGPANVFNGNAYEGVAGASTAAMNGGTLKVGGGSPISVAAQAVSLRAYATQLSQLTANSTVSVSGSSVTLTGTDSKLEVFSLPIADLGGTFNLNINVNPLATILINVLGTSVTTSNSGFFLNGTQVIGDSALGYQKILFNFYQATNINFGGTFQGTVLAPNADITGSNGQVDGGLIAKSFTGSSEFHDLLFTGTLPAQTPEPGTWVMFMLGAGCVGLTRFKRRR